MTPKETEELVALRARVQAQDALIDKLIAALRCAAPAAAPVIPAWPTVNPPPLQPYVGDPIPAWPWNPPPMYYRTECAPSLMPEGTVTWVGEMGAPAAGCAPMHNFQSMTLQ